MKSTINNKLSLVDDTSGEFKHVLLHYCRSFHHLYDQIINSLDAKTKITIVAPNLENDDTDICNIDEQGNQLPNYKNGPEYSLKQFIKESEHIGIDKKFLPILKRLSEKNSMIYKTEYSDKKHPVFLLSHPNITHEVVDHMISPYCRDTAFFCDEKNIIIGNPNNRKQKKAILEEKVLKKDGFKFHPHLNLIYDESGDLVVSNKKIYFSQNYLFYNQATQKEIKKTFKQIRNNKSSFFMPNGVAYHLDMFFSPLDPETVAVGDLKAGREILRENNIVLSEDECYSEVVSDQMGLSFDNRQSILNNMAQVFSKDYKVFRVPIFSFRMGETPFFLSSLNLLSTDSKLWIPDYNIPGADEVRNIFEDIGKHTNKNILYMDKMGAYGLKDASLRCIVGNMERRYN